MRWFETLEELQKRLDRIPPLFRDDGCSGAPDRLFWRTLRPACRVHDYWYCTRGWPPGTLDQAHRQEADRFLGESVRALLPWGFGWIGWIYYKMVHQIGGTEAYDSCGLVVGVQCRHGLYQPPWMLWSSS